MAEQADAPNLKFGDMRIVRVQVPSPTPLIIYIPSTNICILDAQDNDELMK